MINETLKELLEERKEVEWQMKLLEDRWEAINQRIDELKEME